MQYIDNFKKWARAALKENIRMADDRTLWHYKKLCRWFAILCDITFVKCSVGVIFTDVSIGVSVSLVVPEHWEQVLLLSRNLKCDSVLLDHDKITNEVIVKLSGKSHCCGRNTNNACCNNLLQSIIACSDLAHTYTTYTYKRLQPGSIQQFIRLKQSIKWLTLSKALDI